MNTKKLYFQFGKNWANFLRYLNEERIHIAKLSLETMLNQKSLKGKAFLDVGCGSGLYSLAAKQMGAKVVSFDYDLDSVKCAQELKNKFFHNDPDWIIEQGSVLDGSYLATLGKFDIVYAWGVLHHTGHMWQAIENISHSVSTDGILYLSIYNDQGFYSKLWKKIKLAYNKLPRYFRFVYLSIFFAYFVFKNLFVSFITGNLKIFIDNIKNYKKNRGMSYWHDIVDWIGGYPFEVSKPEAVFDFYKIRNFTLLKLKTCGSGLGCNEYIFKKIEH